jgi:hypothetical protein
MEVGSVADFIVVIARQHGEENHQGANMPDEKVDATTNHGELSDAELENVSGGAPSTPTATTTTTTMNDFHFTKNVDRSSP